MNSNMPRVSVLMTSYNRQEYIGEAIESVLASSLEDFELIIVDDGSKDDTVSIAENHLQQDSRIKLYVNPVNLGDYPNRNKAASHAKGEFIMFVDSDDKILKDGIENCVKAMQSFPNANFGMYTFTRASKPYEVEMPFALRQHLLIKPGLMIGPGGTIIKKSFFDTINGYPEKYGPANDLYFNLKACSYSNVIMLPFDFLYYRYHAGQEQNNRLSYLHNNYSYMKDAIKELNLPLNKNELRWLGNKNKRRFLVNMVKYYLKTKKISNIRKVLKLTNFGLRDFLAALFN